VRPDTLIEEDLTRSVIGAFFEVYNGLGVGYLESIYSRALEYELTCRGHLVEREVGVLVLYKNVEVGLQRIDLLVDHKVIVEIKSTIDLHPIALRQLKGYLRSTKIEVGLLLHFGPEAKFHRMVCSRSA
jgi:GxxExxY protein